MCEDEEVRREKVLEREERECVCGRERGDSIRKRGERSVTQENVGLEDKI